MFKYSVALTGPEAEQLSHPTDQQMRPYPLAARKALADREGYSERIYGHQHYKIPSGIKDYGIVVLDADVGTVLYTSQQ